MERTASRIPGTIVGLVFLAVVGLVLAQLPGLLRAMPEPVYDLPKVLQPEKPRALPPLDPHALLHPEAEYIHQQLSMMDTRFCRFDCGAKGTKYYCNIDGRWALAVVVEGVKTITAFWVGDGYSYDPRDDPGCHPINPLPSN
jgi:hypothetical protein